MCDSDLNVRWDICLLPLVKPKAARSLPPAVSPMKSPTGVSLLLKPNISSCVERAAGPA